VQVGRDLVNLLNVSTRKRRSAATSSSPPKLFLLALADDKGEAGALLKQAGLTARPSRPPSTPCVAARTWAAQEAEGQREALKKYTIDLTERARRQARSGDRPRRRDPPRASRSCSAAPRTTRC
jgi:ATP-dependent Clp protease ATP-binding subunit ClpB